jgi:DNA processing protein
MNTDKPVIVSGLAYGIDTEAHTAALDNGMPTVAVLGHGLDTIYPHSNRSLAKRILDQGGALLTEYPLDTEIQPAYFPARNRIVAALADATVVVESAERGGGLITANIANGYNREVFAVPGRLDDPLSQGCNNLIANNKAIIIRNAGDLYFQMGWKSTINNARHHEQQELFATLKADEQQIANLLQEYREMTMDEMEKKSDLSLPKIASLLMEMELKGAIRCLPGKIYKLS